MSLLTCPVCTHAGDVGPNYLFRLRVMDLETNTAYTLDVHLHCIGVFAVDRPSVIVQALGRTTHLEKKAIETRRVERIERKHLFLEPA